MDNDEKTSLCALNRIFGFRPGIAIALIRSLGSASAVFRLERDRIDMLLGPYSRYSAAISGKSIDEAEKELRRAEDMGVHFIGRGDPDYPKLLAECDDAPAGLYFRGSSHPSEVLGGRDSVSVVGTRDISPYGREWCTRIVMAISGSCTPPAITSGLAYGTDITAHSAAMDAGAGTIAVMATGIDLIYPAAHRHKAAGIAAMKGCALISDFPLGTPPSKINFLRRNRIIAGLSRATILVESRMKGGGMITARQAFSYDRDVYALPGRADDIRSQGCNFLIRSGIATPVTSAEDIAESLGLSCRRQRKPVEETVCSTYSGKLAPEKVEAAARLLLTVKKNRGITLQELTVQTGWNYSLVAELSGILAADGFLSIDILQRCSINAKID